LGRKDPKEISKMYKIGFGWNKTEDTLTTHVKCRENINYRKSWKSV